MKIYYVAILAGVLLAIGLILIILGHFILPIYFIGEGMLLLLIFVQLQKESQP